MKSQYTNSLIVCCGDWDCQLGLPRQIEFSREAAQRDLGFRGGRGMRDPRVRGRGAVAGNGSAPSDHNAGQQQHFSVSRPVDQYDSLQHGSPRNYDAVFGVFPPAGGGAFSGFPPAGGPAASPAPSDSLSGTASSTNPDTLSLTLHLPRYWCNIKYCFENLYGVRVRDMEHMLHFLGMPLEGHHHSGIDDCRNIGRLCKRMIQDGARLKGWAPWETIYVTTWRKWY